MKNEMGGERGTNGERRVKFRVSVEEPERKRPFRRHRRRWEDDIGWIFKKWDGGIDQIDLAQDRDR
jgi:hypothetical protein